MYIFLQNIFFTMYKVVYIHIKNVYYSSVSINGLLTDIVASIEFPELLFRLPLPVGFATAVLSVLAKRARENVRDVGFADFSAGEMDPRPTVVALDHRPTGEGLVAKTCDQIPILISII